MKLPSPWKEKLRAWNRVPAACLLHNAVGFHASRHVLHCLGQWERDKARKFMGLRRRPEDTNFAFNQRTKQIIIETFRRNNEAMIHHRVLRAHHRW
eukprot:12262182-Karenia_brevis.AAC.1